MGDRARFEYSRVVATVVELDVVRVALQFDAGSLGQAPLVVWDLTSLLPAKVELFVLGDAAADGAVDAVCAAHVDAELIV